MIARIILLLAPIASLGCGINNSCGQFNPFGCAKDDEAGAFGTSVGGETVEPPTTSTSTDTSIASSSETTTPDLTITTAPVDPTTASETTSTNDPVTTDDTTSTSETTDTTDSTTTTSTSETTDTTMTTSPPPMCGNKIVEDEEECDDDTAKCGDDCQFVRLRVFVTSKSYKANAEADALGGIDGADTKCNSHAKNANSELPGKYKAWLSTDIENASTRLASEAFTGLYVLVDGTQIAEGWNELIDASLDHAINIDENGTKDILAPAWTGTKPDGTKVLGQNCGAWIVSGTAVVGSSSDADMKWSQSGMPQACSTMKRLYCFEVP